MLMKLIKYELKSSTKMFAIIFTGLIGVSILFGFFVPIINKNDVISNINFNNGNGLLIILTIIAINALILATFIANINVIINRFNKSIFKEEGYLIHLLPVSKQKILLSRIFVALIWLFITILIAVLSFILILLIIVSRIDFEYLKNINFNLLIDFISNQGLEIFRIFETIIASYIEMILTIYLCMAIGKSFNKNKTFISIIAFMVIAVFIPIITLYLGFDLSYTNEKPEYLFEIKALISIFKSVIYFTIITYLLKNKLNLE